MATTTISVAKNIPLDIKYIFLRFAQAYFSESSKFKWDYDVTKTKIIIADRNAVELGVATLKPAIILTRGPLNWGYVVRGQSGMNAVNVADGKMTSISNDGAHVNIWNIDPKTDLMYGSVTFTILSKNGIQAEAIANDLFVALTGYRQELTAAGIYKFTGMGIGSETILRADVENRLIGVPINISFITKENILRSVRNYNVYTYQNGSEIFEGSDYEVVGNGTQIKLSTVAGSSTFTIDYRDAITLESKTNITVLPTEDTQTYLVPDGGKILGYYDILRDINYKVREQE